MKKKKNILVFKKNYNEINIIKTSDTMLIKANKKNLTCIKIYRKIKK
ncbi:MAG TPA: hypothetical protein ACYCDB_01310 [Candidatus Azoamicus sp.]